MPIFFPERVDHDLALLSKEDSHHALRVLRLRLGSTVQAAWEGRRFAGELTQQNGLAAVRLKDELPSTEASLRLTLYQGLPKGDKLEGVIRSATELGAAAIVPCLFSRCVARAEAVQEGRKRERLLKIAREAAMLSYRTALPEIGELLNFEALCDALMSHQLALVPWEEADAPLPAVPEGVTDIALVIGPEGGITAEEIKRLAAVPVSLGPRILRTETAGAAAMAMVMAKAGRC
ncbi:MAG: RsmE family RNA methyltransferase [Christensenellales bacterium]|jgi:16S rRNA (uracil1498-N3)-methyltransferase